MDGEGGGGFSSGTFIARVSYNLAPMVTKAFMRMVYERVEFPIAIRGRKRVYCFIFSHTNHCKRYRSATPGQHESNRRVVTAPLEHCSSTHVTQSSIGCVCRESLLLIIERGIRFLCVCVCVCSNSYNFYSALFVCVI